MSAMPKQMKKGTKVTGTNTTKNKSQRRRISRNAELARQGRKQVPLTPVKILRKSCFLRCEQLGKNGNKLDRKQYKLLSGP